MEGNIVALIAAVQAGNKMDTVKAVVRMGYDDAEALRIVNGVWKLMEERPAYCHGFNRAVASIQVRNLRYGNLVAHRVSFCDPSGKELDYGVNFE